MISHDIHPRIDKRTAQHAKVLPEGSRSSPCVAAALRVLRIACRACAARRMPRARSAFRIRPGARITVAKYCGVARSTEITVERPRSLRRTRCPSGPLPTLEKKPAYLWGVPDHVLLPCSPLLRQQRLLLAHEPPLPHHRDQEAHAREHRHAHRRNHVGGEVAIVGDGNRLQCPF